MSEIDNLWHMVAEDKLIDERDLTPGIGNGADGRSIWLMLY